MRTIAIVEDDDTEFLSIKKQIEKFAEESDGKINVRCVRFCDAVMFLQNYRPVYDIVLMDIGLPGINGFDAAKKLRELDDSTLLIFVTNMSRFAVAGYEVGAFDFVVKPVKYGALRLKLLRAFQKLDAGMDKKIRIPSPEGTRLVSVSSIRYVEVMNHDVIYHTANGDIRSYGSLKKAETLLDGENFARCNSCYLVNLRYVTGFKEFSVFVGGEEISISHAKKKEFLNALTSYMEKMS